MDQEAVLSRVIRFFILLVLVMLSAGCSRRVVSSEELDRLIVEVSSRHGLSAPLLKAVVWQESRFDPTRVGKKGEVGLMQLMDGAVDDWARVNRCEKPSREELFDPELNLEIGAWYLSWTGSLWPGRESREILQLAAYNAGCGKVEKLWLPEDESMCLELDMITYPGTRDYITKILSKAQVYEEAGLGKELR
jgi:soluble lytic murein transglycosylase